MSISNISTAKSSISMTEIRHDDYNGNVNIKFDSYLWMAVYIFIWAKYETAL